MAVPKFWIYIMKEVLEEMKNKSIWRNLYEHLTSIESLCKLLGESVLLSAEFATCDLDHIVSLGEHSLQGIDAPVEIFALRDPE